MSVIAAKGTQQVQDIDEEIVNVEVQGHGCTNVIGLAATDDATGIKQYQTRHNQDNARRDGLEGTTPVGAQQMLPYLAPRNMTHAP